MDDAPGNGVALGIAPALLDDHGIESVGTDPEIFMLQPGNQNWAGNGWIDMVSPQVVIGQPSTGSIAAQDLVHAGLFPVEPPDHPATASGSEPSKGGLSEPSVGLPG